MKLNGTIKILFDRDLNNFRLLFDLRVISVGIIITRSDELQQIFDKLNKGDSYGASTTHMSKLLPRINGGGGAGCPILVFGITKNCMMRMLNLYDFKSTVAKDFVNSIKDKSYKTILADPLEVSKSNRQKWLLNTSALTGILRLI